VWLLVLLDLPAFCVCGLLAGKKNIALLLILGSSALILYQGSRRDYFTKIQSRKNRDIDSLINVSLKNNLFIPQDYLVQFNIKKLFYLGLKLLFWIYGVWKSDVTSLLAILTLILLSILVIFSGYHKYSKIYKLYLIAWCEIFWNSTIAYITIQLYYVKKSITFALFSFFRRKETLKR
jgi:hypothetical protein